MKTLSLAVYLSAVFLVCSCSSDTVVTDPHTPVGTPVSLTVFNGFFKGYTTLGTQHTGTQLRFGNMTGSVIFANMTAHRPPPSCSGSYTIVAVGPTLFETRQVTESTTSFALLTGPTAPLSTFSQRYFLVSDGSFYKITTTPGTLSYVPNNFTMPPNPANVGDFGRLATLDGSDGSTLTIDWVLSPEFFGNSIMIITSTTTNILHVVTATEVYRYYLDRAGNPYKLGITVTTGGATTTLTGNKT